MSSNTVFAGSSDSKMLKEGVLPDNKLDCDFCPDDVPGRPGVLGRGTGFVMLGTVRIFMSELLIFVMNNQGNKMIGSTIICLS
mmetsp:Transcript_642/g.1483  ORF Transcript_642/g.1483 Transcript_642/m.1483 type:complete len:83 (-) Transcript_642:59-307(-)